MQVSCFDCELRACGLFKPVSGNELGAINEIKRDHIVLPVFVLHQANLPSGGRGD